MNRFDKIIVITIGILVLSGLLNEHGSEPEIMIIHINCCCQEEKEDVWSKFSFIKKIMEKVFTNSEGCVKILLNQTKESAKGQPEAFLRELPGTYHPEGCLKWGLPDQNEHPEFLSKKVGIQVST